MEGAYNIPFSLGDKGLIELVGPTGLGKLTVRIGHILTKAQTGHAEDLAGSLLFAVLVLLLCSDFTGITVAVSSTGF